MDPILVHAATALVTVFLSVLGLALFLTFAGHVFGAAATRAPVLDLLVALLTWIPWIIAVCCFGWIGLPAAIAGQVLALLTWCFIHERLNAEAARGPRIIKFINRTAGRWRNPVALWVTVSALPVFWMIRFVEIGLYWFLPALLNFPTYRQGEWVNVSRQKFGGLVGHDLIWCLYCDWMTGVYSLGAEMLRNVESFWCPIRFYDGKKCDNCKLDFPDIQAGWVKADGTMTEVVDLLEDKYAGGERAWFGHPVRLTVKGEPPRT
ncbi:MAG: hypothetical protein H7144_11500 [Burkholderiales bacterium]|nr:hypothetical protein [Phycisphaerae bacterium]